jgi:hypothetical protein
MILSKMTLIKMTLSVITLSTMRPNIIRLSIMPPMIMTIKTIGENSEHHKTCFSVMISVVMLCVVVSSVVAPKNLIA